GGRHHRRDRRAHERGRRCHSRRRRRASRHPGDGGEDLAGVPAGAAKVKKKTLSSPGSTRRSIILAKKMDARVISAFTRVFYALLPAHYAAGAIAATPAR